MVRFTYLQQQTVLLLASAYLLSACDGPPPPPARPPTSVSVVKLQAQALTLTQDLPGRHTAEVRARVPGIVHKRFFTEGSEVQAGDLLYELDPGPFAANLASAKAVLERTQAQALASGQKIARYQSLLADQAISVQEYDEANAADKQAQADVAVAQAALAKAELDLSYTRVTAPISGQIGRALVTVGTLVGQGDATPLALIQSTTEMYVNFFQPAEEALQTKLSIEQGRLHGVDREGAVELLLPDGTLYPRAGRLLFTDITIDPSTGMLALRAIFPNPQKTLLPGGFVQVRLRQGVDEHALLVPQPAVLHQAHGASVYVVAEGDKVAVRSIQLGKAYSNQWIVKDGLQPGDQVIVEGLQKIKPGQVVKPLPLTALDRAQNDVVAMAVSVA
jgi:membrane fusion protein (multidrug efflux system)